MLFRRIGAAEQRLAQAEVRIKSRSRRRIVAPSLKDWPWLHILAMMVLFLLGLPNIAPEEARQEARNIAARLLDIR